MALELWGLVLFAFLLLLIAFGMPIPFAFLVAAAVGLAVTQGLHALPQIPRQIFAKGNSYELLSLPLFIFMGSLTASAGISQDLYDSLYKWLNRMPGSGFVASILGCTIYSACVGSSAAVAAAITPVALPQMIRVGYDRKLACGCIGAADLGQLIPPSAGFILYALLTGASIGKLFIAGIVPALVFETLFLMYITARVLLNPRLAPRIAGGVSWRERFTSLRGVWPFPIIIFAVLGTIFAGVATPTEAAGIGALSVIGVALILRKLTTSALNQALRESAKLTSWVALILGAGVAFGKLMVQIGFSDMLVKAFPASMPPYAILGIMTLVYVILGMFLDSGSMMVLTLPVFFPIILQTGLDPVWFGVIVISTAELGLITPPVGIVCFIIHKFAAPYGISLGDVFRGHAGFAVAMLVGLVLLVFFPQLSLWLPSMMLGR